MLNRYLEEDIVSPLGYKVPRFLLNDIVRFWRTMAVDFASKQRLRAGQGWGLRNAKLRISRKLTFVSGMLMCFSCATVKRDSEDSIYPLIDHLEQCVRKTPLEILADALLKYGSNEISKEILDVYDDFFSMVNNPDIRAHLDNLDSNEARSDETFQTVRELGRRFQEGLTKLFFEGNQELKAFTQEYGVF